MNLVYVLCRVQWLPEQSKKICSQHNKYFKFPKKHTESANLFNVFKKNIYLTFNLYNYNLYYAVDLQD